jgi:hypothetical protein
MADVLSTAGENKITGSKPILNISKKGYGCIVGKSACNFSAF